MFEVKTGISDRDQDYTRNLKKNLHVFMIVHTELKRSKRWVFEIFEVKTEINDHPVKNDF